MKKFVISILAAVTLVFSGNLLFAADLGLPSSFKYPIRRGTTLSRIAKDFGVSQKTLIEANQGNPSFKSPDKILAGGKLNIPKIYTQTDIADIRASDKRITDEAIRAIARDAKTYKAESSNKSVYSFLLTIACAILLVLCLQYHIKYWDKKTLLESAENGLVKAGEDLRKLQLSDAEKDQIIKHLQINLQISQERVSALGQAKNEAENLRNERVELLNKLEELAKEADRIRLERGVLFVKLAAKISAGDKIHVETRANTTMELLVNKTRIDPDTKEIKIYVECLVKECVVNVTQTLEAKNALSHMAGHSNLLPEVRHTTEPKEESPIILVGASQTEGFPAEAANEPK